MKSGRKSRQAGITQDAYTKLRNTITISHADKWTFDELKIADCDWSGKSIAGRSYDISCHYGCLALSVKC